MSGSILTSILLGFFAISLFLIMSWLFDKKKQRFKAHMLFKADQQLSSKKKHKRNGELNNSNYSLLDILLLNIKPLKKFSPSVIIHDAQKHEWDFSVSNYYVVYILSSSVIALLMYVYLGKNLAGIIVGFFIGVIIPRVMLYYKKKKYSHSVNDRLAVYMKTMANSMSVLGNVVDALNETIKLVHPSLKPELSRAVSLLQSGKSVTHAFEEMCKKYDFNDFIFFHEMLEVSHDTGGEYMDVLMNIAEDFEQGKLLQAKLDTAMSQAKKAYVYNSLIFVGLPFLFYFFHQPVYNILMSTKMGPAVLVFFLALLLGFYYKVETLTRFDTFKS